MTTVDIRTVVSRLQDHYAALGTGRDCRTDNERANWFAATTTCQRIVTALRNLPNDIERAERRLADLVAQRAEVVAKQADIEQQLLDAPDALTFADARERDKELGRQQHLGRQLQLLRNGELLAGPGVTYPRLQDLDARIAEVQHTIAVMRGNLDHYVREAEALLSASTVS